MRDEQLLKLARVVLIDHASIGGRNSEGGINPPCACTTCQLAHAVLGQELFCKKCGASIPPREGEGTCKEGCVAHYPPAERPADLRLLIGRLRDGDLPSFSIAFDPLTCEKRESLVMRTMDVMLFLNRRADELDALVVRAVKFKEKK